MKQLFKSWLEAAEPIPQAGSVRGQFYERTGECHQCGKCCREIYLVHGEQTIDSIKLFEQLKPKNPEYQHFKPVEETEHGVLFQCVHLTPENHCGIYNQRPQFCQKYPSEKAMLLGATLAQGCGYQFKPLQSFQQVLTQAAEPTSAQKGNVLT